MCVDDDFIIQRVDALQVLDSRGDPTVEVSVATKKGVGRAIAPSGASKSRFEAVELRDGDPRVYRGRSVLRAVENVRRYIAPALAGLDSRAQRFIDGKLIEIDGTPNKSRIGGNAITATSLAVLKAASDSMGLPLFRYVGGLRASVLPIPMMNIINGGAHAGNDLAFQEFMIVPVGFDSFSESLRAGVEVYKYLKDILKERYGAAAINLGDEGGFSPPMKSIYEALDALSEAVRRAGYDLGGSIYISLDVAGSQIYDQASGSYVVDGSSRDLDGMIDLYMDIVERYSILSIEDPFHEEDAEGFARLVDRLKGRAIVVGDDLLSTNAERLRRALEGKQVTGALVKVNQAGTFTEALEYVELARDRGIITIMSHRSGDSEDNAIAHLAVGMGTPMIKTGAPARSERTSKYNELLRIESYLAGESVFFGEKILLYIAR